MFMIKKRNFIFVIIVSVLVGALAIGGSVLVAGQASGGYRTITNEEYEDYKLMKQKYGKLAELEKYIQERYYVPVDESALMEGLYKGLFWGIGDPYSAYLSKDEYEEIMISTTGEYQGVGVTIAPDERGLINVVSPIDGSPADKAGIMTGDKIISVEGEVYDGSSIDQAAAAMRGKPGTKVDLVVIRGQKELQFTITRANIIMQTVRSEVLDGNIGYIRISSFEEKTADDFKQHLRDMELKGVQGLILDLRDNGGGLVEVSIEVADALLDEGTVTYTEDRQGNKEYYKSKPGKTGLPYIVLVNGGTASASEIVTGAIKDHNSGKIIGTTTYGKGIIQSIEQLSNGDAVKLTIMQYFSPDGNVIHKVGIKPDIEVEELADDEVDQQLEKAKELLKLL
ncbi:MAG: S41 family peptidase [Eubacteriales bacterium]|nr:S41 family peptidase [Eubacteriales bacterium]MDD3200156.1 S41 family peptidase [Eubacteriales bacterium]MDD4629076.1 S41 family peptidase [Eubacteriales bacterium]